MSARGGVKTDSAAWLTLAKDFSARVVRDVEIIRARFPAAVPDDAPELLSVMEAYPGSSYLHREEEGLELVLVRPLIDRRPRWWLHALLFAFTILTTHMAGAMMAGVDPFATRFLEIGGVGIPYPSGLDLGSLAAGTSFSLPFVAILLAHEMGHYLMALRHRVPVTPPFFLPFPAYYSLIGSLGAFIRIRGPMVRRTILLDVGAGGPLASFVLALPFAWIGLRLSVPVQGVADVIAPYAVIFFDQPIWIGNGLLFHALASLVAPVHPGEAPLLLHPMAFAGWLGLFVTALNLLPLGQLDGGHILYAYRPSWQRRVGRMFLLALLPLGLVWWGWWPWAVVAFAVNRGRIEHPPVLQEGVRPGPWRRRVAVVCILLFFLTFSPVPLRLVN